MEVEKHEKKLVQIRPSQFITAYGVGALMDGPEEGPCIVKDFRKSKLFQPNQSPDDSVLGIEISLLGASRLSKRLPLIDLQRKIHYDCAGNIGIFEFPGNAKLKNRPDMYAIYELKSFPTWSLCSQHKGYSVLYERRNGCHECKRTNPAYDNEVAHKEVIRFIRICPNGHLTDIDWIEEVHGKSICGDPKLRWYDLGTSLSNIIIQCQCGKSTTLENVMEVPFFCRGPFPERDDRHIFRRCGLKTQLFPRNASSVFVPEIYTSISLPVEANDLYKILSSKGLRTDILKDMRKGVVIDWKYVKQFFEDIKAIPEYVEGKEFIPIIEKINPKEYSIADNIVKYFVNTILKNRTSIDETEMRREEFNEFLSGSGSLSFDPRLVIDRKHEIYLPVGNLKFRITPISRLEVINVQAGYKRICYYENAKTPRINYTPYIIENNYVTPNAVNWYPGVKLQGEGIFISLDSASEPYFRQEIFKSWDQCYKASILFNSEMIKIEKKRASEEPKKIEPKKSGTKKQDNNEEEDDIPEFDEHILEDIVDRVMHETGYSIAEEKKGKMQDIKPSKGSDNKKDKESDIDKNSLKLYRSWLEKIRFRKISEFMHPIGVWWHTFSHRIIKAIAQDCGYSAVSLRERLYFDPQTLKGGVLVYTARPGEDGALGGLVSQVPRMKQIFQILCSDLDSCSNDPICFNTDFHPFELNGAACYSCLFLAETSCEFGNIGLDRRVLIDSFFHKKH